MLSTVLRRTPRNLLSTIPKFYSTELSNEALKEVDEATNKVMHLLEVAKDRGYIGEPVSQQEHALQAAYLAKTSKFNDDETVLGALLHDIGHLCAVPGSEMMGNVGIKGHENIGGQYLKKKGFSKKVIDLVESHVVVKRYLTFRFPDYLESLSDASKTSLKFQGGPMSEKEAYEFERDPNFLLKIKLREWDDTAKEVDFDVPNLESYREMMRNHLLKQKLNSQEKSL